MSTTSRSMIATSLLALCLAAPLATAGPQGVAGSRPAVSRPHAGSGISPGEAARIRFQVQQHRNMQRRAAADGQISRREQAVLKRDAAQIRRLIQTARRN